MSKNETTSITDGEIVEEDAEMIEAESPDVAEDREVTPATPSKKSGSNVVLILGVVVVVLVVAVVGVVLLTSNNANKAATTITEQTVDPTGETDSNGNATGGMMGATDESFDAATAQKIPADSTPEKWVKAYYDLCDKSDWEKAWTYLPAAKREKTTADALKTQLEGYGIVGWKMGDITEDGDEMTISAAQETSSYGTFTSNWTFVKDSDGKTWLLKSKAVSGMQ